MILGCAGESVPDDNAARAQRIQSPIPEKEVVRFLKITARLPDNEPPTFSPLTESFYADDPADRLIDSCRARFEKQFDVVRQGKIWKQNRTIRSAAAREGCSTTELAGIMSALSTAICRAQIEDIEELKRLERKGEKETARLKKRLDQIDQRLSQQKTTVLSRQRTELAIKLSRNVALVEYLKVLQEVPEENIALVRRYHEELAMLVDQSALDNLDPKSLTAAFDE